jgi:HSP20 family molecular chaperone IbpA
MTALNELKPEQKYACQPADSAEHSRNRPVFTPRTDIYETADSIIVVADLPGVDQSGLDITLEQNKLTINGYLEPDLPEGHTLTYAEYAVGDYHRSFALSNEIDCDGIAATLKNGVLKLVLPKSNQAKTKRITVQS